MKKKLGVTILVTTIFVSSTAFGGTIPKINVNSHKILAKNSPFIENNRTYIPLRNVSENLGAKVDWNNNTRTVTIKKGDKVIKQAIGKDIAEVNGKSVKLDAKAQIKNNVTYVPVRFISEVLGAEVKFNGKERIIDINIEQDPTIKYDNFGKIIRTTNLPKNYKNYPYILQGIPNDMYEMKMYHEFVNWQVKPIEGEHYTRPVNMEKMNTLYNEPNLMIWKSTTEKNLDLRLNVDYRTVDKKWVEGLLSTYEALDYDIYKTQANEYVKYLKDNKIIVEGDYYVEPSMAYDDVEMRVWVKFKFTSNKVKKALFYNSISEFGFKTNVWYEGYIDMGLSTVNGWSDGSDYRFQKDELIISQKDYFPLSTIKEIR